MSTLHARVATHIGACNADQDGRMQCPSCHGWDFGPTMPLHQLAVYLDNYLPGAPLLMGVCMDCEHVTRPTDDLGDLADALNEVASERLIVGLTS